MDKVFGFFIFFIILCVVYFLGAMTAIKTKISLETVSHINEKMNWANEECRTHKGVEVLELYAFNAVCVDGSTIYQPSK